MKVPLKKAASTLPFWVLLSTIVFTRLLAMFFLPLIDPSEARYAEIARKLIELNDWITLYHDYGVPFWAKPPLSSWISSLGMLLFGINEFAARLPIFLMALALTNIAAPKIQSTSWV